MGRKRRAFAILGLALALAPAACSLFVDTGGFTGADAPVADASSDVAPSDATDAAAESADAVTPPGSCRDTFFDSFDDGALGAKWDSLEQTGATLSLDAAGSSPPNALLVTRGTRRELQALVRVRQRIVRRFRIALRGRR